MDLAHSHGVPAITSTADEIAKQVGARDHQGVMAKMPEYPYSELSTLLKRLPEEPFLLLLDGIQDPFNFGAILRSAEVFGVNGIIVPNASQARVTPQVVRSSAGAVHWIPIAETPDVSSAVSTLQEKGIRVIAADGASDQLLFEVDYIGSICLLIGNEGTGIDPKLVQQTDAAVRIPQSGNTESLNAAVATGVLCYEVNRQRVGT